MKTIGTKLVKGFTLIELLVVIAIIGLLSTLAVVSLNSARTKSRDAKRVADIKQLQSALELFYGDQNGYPGVAAAGVALGVAATTNILSAVNGFSSAASGTTYMSGVPAAPTPPTGNAYTYKAWDVPAKTTACTTGTACGYYEITFTLEAATGGYALGAHTASPAGVQ